MVQLTLPNSLTQDMMVIRHRAGKKKIHSLFNEARKTETKVPTTQPVIAEETHVLGYFGPVHCFSDSSLAIVRRNSIYSWYRRVISACLLASSSSKHRYLRISTLASREIPKNRHRELRIPEKYNNVWSANRDSKGCRISQTD